MPISQFISKFHSRIHLNPRATLYVQSCPPGKTPLVAEESPGEDGKAIIVLEVEPFDRWEAVPLALVEGVRLAGGVAGAVVVVDAEAELAGLHVLQPMELESLRSVPVPVHGCLVPGVVICSKDEVKVMIVDRQQTL